jgi:signal transduction histidine kinase
VTEKPLPAPARTGLHACLRGFPGAVIEVAGDGSVVDSNGKLEGLLGRAVVGRPFVDALDSTSRAKWNRLLAREGDSAPSQMCELVLQGRESLELRTFAMVWGDEGAGECVWLVEYVRDLRLEPLYEELSAASSELARIQRELEKERARLARALARQEAAVRQRDEVLAIVAHDLRNPLDRISTSVSMLMEDTLDASSRSRLLDVVKRTTTGMNQLVRDLLDAASIDAGRLALDRRSTDAGSIVQIACELFQSQASARALQLECRASDAAVEADQGRILQALGNLLGNAIRLTPSGGRIVLGVEPNDDVVHFFVSDTGPGIPEEDQEHLFERFWQAKRGRRGGAGLGLAITKGIVEAHGGRIWVDSAPGQGSTFHFTIPAPARAP